MNYKSEEHKCYLCGSSTTLLYDFKVSQIRSCPECGLMRSCPLPAKTNLKSLYSKKPGYDAKRKSEVLNSDILEKLKDFLLVRPLLKKLKNICKDGNNPELLDIGCSTGWITSISRECGFCVTGLEANSHSAEIAREKYALNIIEGFLEDVTIDNSYDAISMFHVFEHFVEPKHVLARIKELLSSEGRLLIVVPNSDSLGTKIFKQHYNWNVKHHVSFFSPKSLSIMLRNNGFEILDMKTLPSTPMLHTSFNRWMGFRKAQSKISHKLKNRILGNLLMLPLAMVGNLIGRGEVLVVFAEKIDSQAIASE